MAHTTETASPSYPTRELTEKDWYDLFRVINDNLARIATAVEGVSNGVL